MALALGSNAQARPAGAQSTGFFVTSANPGKGADLGGLAGADAHCQPFRRATGTRNRTWRAYLGAGGASPVNARDRIGRGPWANAKGEVIARDVAQLHGENNLNIQTALAERASR